jgi:hypothetical protein
LEATPAWLVEESVITEGESICRPKVEGSSVPYPVVAMRRARKYLLVVSSSVARAGST